MSKYSQGITNQEAYEEIVRLNLYEFASKKPSAIVNEIEGLINEDKLGLSRIYLQAKRYAQKIK